MTKATVRDKYKDLSREELIEKAYELGAGFEMYSNGCAQAVVAAIHEMIDIDDVVVKVSVPLCGGTARQLAGTCGALSGGLLVCGYFFGRSSDQLSYKEHVQSNVDALKTSFDEGEVLADRFWKEYGTLLCPHIQRQLFGRTWWLADPDNAAKYAEAGGHTDPDKCCYVVGMASRWLMEILLDKGVIESPSLVTP